MSWLECLYFYLRSGQPELFTDLDSTFWRLESLEIICLSSFIYSSSVVLFSLYLVIIFKLLLYFISSIVSYVTLIYLYSSFMNYYFTYFRCTIITLCLWSVIFIYCIFWDLPNFIYNAVFWAIQVRHVRMRMVENIGLLQLVSELWLWGKT